MRSLLLIVACLLVAAPAMADDDPPLDSPAHTRLIVDSVAIGRQFLGVAPEVCADGVHVYWADLSLVPSEFGGGASGMAHPDTCVVWLTKLWAATGSDYGERIQRCSIIVHEIGHALAGRLHSTWRRSIMWKDPGSLTVRACYDRFKPRGITVRRDAALYGRRIWAVR